MKNIFLILVIVSSKLSFSQTINNPELDKFVGTWQWVSGNDTVTIILNKQVSIFPNGDSREILVGWHKYVQNGQLKESSLQYVGQNINAENILPGSDLQITLYGFTKKPTEIWFNRFWDLTLHKKCHLFFELLPNSLTQATWKLTNPNGPRYMGPTGTYNQFTLPRELVLTKQ